MRTQPCPWRSFPAVLAIVAGVGLAGCDRIESRMIERVASRALTGDRVDFLRDGNLHVVLCGTGSPLPDRERAAACTAVLAGGHLVVVDAGPGSAEQLALERLPRDRIEAVLLTHFHSDHIGDLGELAVQSWIAGRPAPLEVVGPQGVEGVVEGFTQAYAADARYRVAHHGAEALPPAAAGMVARTVVPGGPEAQVVVYARDGLRITAFAVDHEPVSPAYGYRFDYAGRSVVVSGDTRKSSNLIRNARGVDVLVHEALAAHMIQPVTEYARRQNLGRWAKLTSDILGYHTTPVEAAEVAKEAGARMLVFSHIVPNLPNFVARRMFLRGVSAAWDGRVELGRDGMHLSLPPGSQEVLVDSLG